MLTFARHARCILEPSGLNNEATEVASMALECRNISIPAASHYSDVPETSVRRREARFVSQADLDAWVRDRRAIVDGPVLRVLPRDEQYVLQDAARVLGPRGSGADVFGMTGRIVALSELLAIGASVSSDAVRLGRAEYDLQLGYMAHRLTAGD